MHCSRSTAGKFFEARHHHLSRGLPVSDAASQERCLTDRQNRPEADRRVLITEVLFHPATSTRFTKRLWDKFETCPTFGCGLAALWICWIKKLKKPVASWGNSMEGNCLRCVSGIRLIIRHNDYRQSSLRFSQLSRIGGACQVRIFHGPARNPVSLSPVSCEPFNRLIGNSRPLQ